MNIIDQQISRLFGTGDIGATATRKKQRRQCRLTPYRKDIMTLRHELNHSVPTIRKWLKSIKNVEASDTLIHRKLKEWEEL